MSSHTESIEKILDKSRLVPMVYHYPSLASVEVLLHEFRVILSSLPNEYDSLKEGFAKDAEFIENSRYKRLKALERHCIVVTNTIESGLLTDKTKMDTCPDLSSIINIIHLSEIIKKRWLESQICMYNGAYLSSVIMMGSILEALLFGRAQMNVSESYKSKKAPKDKEGKQIKVQDWNLNALIEVATDLSWLKVDRGKFSHALRESRNVVHPWQHMTSNADFDKDTCITCWHVLNASIRDLLNSVS